MIVGIYVNGDMERKLQLLERWMEGREEEIRMVIEDFNAKTREEGGRIRKEIDRKVNKKGKRLIEYIKERE